MTRRLMAWPVLPPSAWARRRRASLPYPLDRGETRVYARARHALWHGVRALGLEPGDEVLIPAFHHGSEVEALVRAGLVCRFYDGGPRLEPDPAELEALLTPRTRALHLIHYLGFPQDAPAWRTWTADRGLLLFEDAAQSWLAEVPQGPVGSFGDLAVFCLYKTYGLPDAAAAVCRAPLPAPRDRPHGGPVRAAKLQAAWVASRVGAPGWGRREGEAYDPEADFALGNPDARPSALSLWLVRRLADPATPERRRRNFAVLRSELGDRLSPAFADPPAGSSPYIFPLDVDDKPAALAALEARGIHAMNLWSVPHPALPADSHPRAAALRRRVIGLPLHQEVQEGDLRGMVSAVHAM